MANEKLLNTRIRLKYDSYAKWIEENPILLPGEVAVAYLTTAAAVKPGEADTQHPVLFKVGSHETYAEGNDAGKHLRFNDLPWASALAADVHAWAKKSESEFIEWVNQQIPDGFTIAVNVTDDDVVDAELKGGKNSVSGSITHARKGPADGFAGAATTTTIDAYGKEMTIKVPKLTVDAYGHVNSASDVDYTVKLPNLDLSGYKTTQVPVNDPTVSGNAAAFIDSITQNANGEITVTKKNITAADLGLASAMHFIGAYAEAPEKAFVGASSERELADGDVYLNTTNHTEYVYSGDKWVELGNEGSHALNTITITGIDGLAGGGDLKNNRTIGIADGGVTTVKIAAKAVTTEKVADNAIGAAQLKSVQGYTGGDAEVWVFCCGSATELVD